MRIKRAVSIVFRGSVVAVMVTATSVLAAPDNGLNTAELKKIRNLSKAILVSRSIEKTRIKKQIEPQRNDIKKIEKIVDGLVAEELAEAAKVELVLTRNAPAATAVFNPQSSKPQKLTPSKTNSQLDGAASLSQKSIKRRELRRKKVLAKKRQINQLRVKLEDKLPSRFAFWKSKTREDRRYERIVNVAKSVETEIDQMLEDGNMDIKKLRALKQRLRLTKPDISIDLKEPTLQARTQHRTQ